jgi:hypothetical protein
MDSRKDMGPLIIFQIAQSSIDAETIRTLRMRVQLPPTDSPWTDIIAALRSAFGSRLDVSHVVAVDDEGDDCSSAIDRGPLFWKTLKALSLRKTGTEGVVFKIIETHKSSKVDISSAGKHTYNKYILMCEYLNYCSCYIFRSAFA